jgi:hypothetical protein
VNLPATTAVAPSRPGPPSTPRRPCRHRGGETTPPRPRPAGGAGRLRRRWRPAAPARNGLVGTAAIERLLVATQKRKSPRLRVGGASCPVQVRLVNGTRFTCTVEIEGTLAPYAVTLRDVDAAGATGRRGTARVRVVEIGASIACTITLGEAVQKVSAVVKDLQGTVVVRG